VTQIETLIEGQIAKLGEDDAAVLSAAQVVKWSAAKATALTSLAISAISPDAIAKLNISSFLGDGGTNSKDIAALTNEQFQKLTPSQIQSLSGNPQLGYISGEQIANVKTLSAIDPSKINYLGTAVASALTPSQMAKFSSDQLESFDGEKSTVFDSTVTDWAYNRGFTVITGTSSVLRGIETSTIVDAPAAGAKITAGKAAVQITSLATAADTIIGGPGADIIIGGNTDSIDAGAGNDTLQFTGQDVLTTIGVTAAATASLNGGDGTDTLLIKPATSGTAGNFIAADFARVSNIETIVFDANATAGTLTLSSAVASGFVTIDASASLITKIDASGYTKSLSVKGEKAITTMIGGDGDDVLVVGNTATATITGNNGDDIITGGAGSNIVTGDAGNDYIIGGAVSDNIQGGTGSDTILGGSAGSDTLDGGEGSDHITGGAGLNGITGGAGDDIIVGGSGSNTVTGDAGNDNITGGAATDNINGGVGNDTILGGSAGSDTLTGGDGDDTISATAADGSASSGSANITGDAGNDIITGGAASDTIDGGAGNDVITGGAGSDDITDGTGADSLTGGAGVDTFKFSTDGSVVGTSLDKITDFNTGGADVIQLGATVTLISADTSSTLVVGTNVRTNQYGLITFATDDDTYAEKVVAVLADVELDAAGSVALFADSGNTYVYYAGATAGNSDDQIIELTGVSGTSYDAITVGTTTTQITIA
jgi:Ca2+-binding RTX toxin-like protein